MKKLIKTVMCVWLMGFSQVFCMTKQEAKRFERYVESLIGQCAANQGKTFVCQGLGLLENEPDTRQQHMIRVIDKVKSKKFPDVSVVVNSAGGLTSVNEAACAEINQEMMASGTYRHLDDNNNLVAQVQLGSQSDYIKASGNKVAVSKGSVTFKTMQDLQKKHAIDAFLSAMMSNSKENK